MTHSSTTSAEIKQNEFATKNRYGLPNVMSVDDAASFLGVNKKTVYAALREKQIPSLRIGRRIVVLTDALITSMSSLAK